MREASYSRPPTKCLNPLLWQQGYEWVLSMFEILCALRQPTHKRGQHGQLNIKRRGQHLESTQKEEIVPKGKDIADAFKRRAQKQGTPNDCQF